MQGQEVKRSAIGNELVQFQEAHQDHVLKDMVRITMLHSNPELLAEVVQMLADTQVKTWLFGGWAEELSGISPLRLHRDIDLLYPAQSFVRLDEFLRAQSEAKEVTAKRFSHKRAFEWQGVLVEVFLVRSNGEALVTNFFGTFPFVWPPDTLLSSVKLPSGEWPCVSAAALRQYRARHGEVEQAYRNRRMLVDGTMS